MSYVELTKINFGLAMDGYMTSQIKNNPVMFINLTTILHKFLVFTMGALSYNMKYYIDQSITTDITSSIATGVLGTIYSSHYNTTIYNFLKLVDPTDDINGFFDNADSYTISGFASSLLRNPFYNENGVVTTATIEGCKNYCQVRILFKDI